MQLYFDICRTEGHGVVFTPEVCAECPEEAVVEVAFGAGDRAMRSRIRAIRAVRPRIAGS